MIFFINLKSTGSNFIFIFHETMSLLDDSEEFAVLIDNENNELTSENRKKKRNDIQEYLLQLQKKPLKDNPLDSIRYTCQVYYKPFGRHSWKNKQLEFAGDVLSLYSEVCKIPLLEGCVFSHCNPLNL